MNVILLGSPGVGKGTLAQRIELKFSLPQISTGDMFRTEITNGSDLGKQAKEFMDKGELVPDQITLDMLKERITKDDCKKGFILDGFPRTIPQAEALDNEKIKIDFVIELTASEAIIIQRLTGRRTCSKCKAIFHVANNPPQKEGICDKCGGELIQRADEKPDVIGERLIEYERKTAPLVKFYKNKGILHEVNTEQPIEDFVEEGIEVLEGIEEQDLGDKEPLKQLDDLEKADE